jgi:hypothetical protein
MAAIQRGDRDRLVRLTAIERARREAVSPTEPAAPARLAPPGGGFRLDAALRPGQRRRRAGRHDLAGDVPAPRLGSVLPSVGRSASPPQRGGDRDQRGRSACRATQRNATQRHPTPRHATPRGAHRRRRWDRLHSVALCRTARLPARPPPPHGESRHPRRSQVPCRLRLDRSPRRVMNHIRLMIGCRACSSRHGWLRWLRGSR